MTHVSSLQKSLFGFATAFAVLCTTSIAMEKLERGVSLELAKSRKAQLDKIDYNLFFELHKQGPIYAECSISFGLSESADDIVIDFNAPRKQIKNVFAGPVGVGHELSPEEFEIKNGHIVIPLRNLKKDAEPSDSRFEITIEFIAGDQSLNRNENFLYTLLVPDRASTVFPCFDQPDLKAKFELSLELPPKWIASANGGTESNTKVENDRSLIQFKPTAPISTYLFAFAAGEFKTITREIEGRKMTMLHRESDEEKVERNVDSIFKTHAFALEWLEEYTDIEYPFAKFDFVLIPSFQYGGMEHVGNIFYNADALFLENSATTNQKLSRASLIAHETAHMWFGDLVTMKWFDDVWLKEVFANFMAAKIVHPSFPDINHRLNFLLKHHPSAYGEDRTAGTYPIQQKLDNLKNAGTLYGRIIYQKAPIVMRQLETMIGEETLQKGLQEYLKKYRFDNAVWDDLINILDAKSEIDLKKWSAAWVKEAGTPELTSEFANSTDSNRKLTITQQRKSPSDKFWSQQVDVRVIDSGKVVFKKRVMIEGKSTDVSLPESVSEYDFYLANGSELGYGYFQLDQKSELYLLNNIHTIKDDVIRGAARMAMYETLIRTSPDSKKITPESYAKSLIRSVETETEPLNRQNVLSQLSAVYWSFLSDEERESMASQIESALWRWLDLEKDSLDNNARAAYYKSLVGIAFTDKTTKRLYSIWEQEKDLNGLPLAESDYISLAAALAIRMPERSDEILQKQLSRITSADRKRRFEFVIPAISPDSKTRDEFFESLKKAENRRPERWALEGLSYLHHPLRTNESEKYILPSLGLLKEIQTTGDIFFPKRWLVSTLGNHQSKSAAKTVRDFLAKRPDYPPQLKRKILQSADLLLRRNR